MELEKYRRLTARQKSLKASVSRQVIELEKYVIDSNLNAAAFEDVRTSLQATLKSLRKILEQVSDVILHEDFPGHEFEKALADLDSSQIDLDDYVAEAANLKCTFDKLLESRSKELNEDETSVKERSLKQISLCPPKWDGKSSTLNLWKIQVEEYFSRTGLDEDKHQLQLLLGGDILPASLKSSLPKCENTEDLFYFLNTRFISSLVPKTWLMNLNQIKPMTSESCTEMEQLLEEIRTYAQYVEGSGHSSNLDCYATVGLIEQKLAPLTFKNFRTWMSNEHYNETPRFDLLISFLSNELALKRGVENPEKFHIESDYVAKNKISGKNVTVIKKQIISESLPLTSEFIENKCKELSKILNEDGMKKCIKKPVRFVGRAVTEAPLQIAIKKLNNQLDEIGHFHNRREIAERINKPPQGDIQVHELFIKAKESAEVLSQEITFDTDEAKIEYMNVHSNIVGILGQAGIGKSTLSKTILLKVCQKKLYDSKYVFFFQFRDIDLKNKSSLLEFLAPSIASDWLKEQRIRDAVLMELEKSEEVCIIMDGYDEANMERFEKCKPVNIHGKETADSFIKNILNGRIFSKAKKLITSRPRQLYDLPEDYRPQFLVNILGLDQTAQKQICQDLCQDNKTEVYKYVLDHSDLSSYCYIPLHCILVMHCLNRILSDKNCSIPFPATMTGIFSAVLGLFIKNKDHYRDKLIVKNLSNLAWNGFSCGKNVFDEDDLKKVDLLDVNLNDFLITSLEEDKTSELSIFCCSESNFKKVAYFHHLALQEFFVAINLLLFTSDEDFAQQNLKENLPTSRYEVVARLMFGLCNESNLRFLKEILRDCNVSAFKFSFLIDLVKPDPDSYKVIDESIIRSFVWAYEMQCKTFSKNVAICVASKVNVNHELLPSDFAAIQHIFEEKNSLVTIDMIGTDRFQADSWKWFLRDVMNKTPLVEMERFILQENKFEIFGAGLLSQCIHKINQLVLRFCNLTHGELKPICDAISRMEQPMKWLLLSSNKMKRDGACQLATCVNKIRKLDILECNLTSDELEPICDAISRVTEPMELFTLSKNKLGENGALQLSKVFPNVKKLDLIECNLTYPELKPICDAIKNMSQPMEELYLQDNKLDIDGTRVLAKCVHNVKNLVMRSCDLTDDKMEPILDEISKLSEPMELLNLSVNNKLKGDEKTY